MLTGTLFVNISNNVENYEIMYTLKFNRIYCYSFIIFLHLAHTRINRKSYFGGIRLKTCGDEFISQDKRARKR